MIPLADRSAPTTPPYVPDPADLGPDPERQLAAGLLVDGRERLEQLARLDALLGTGILDRVDELLATRDEVKRMGYAEGVSDGRDQGAAHWGMIEREGYQLGYARARHEFAARLKDRARTDPVARTLLLDLLDGTA